MNKKRKGSPKRFHHTHRFASTLSKRTNEDRHPELLTLFERLSKKMSGKQEGASVKDKVQRYRNKRRQRQHFKTQNGDPDGFNVRECPRELLDMQDFLIQMCHEEDTKSANYSLNNGQGDH